jgi:hypothetical protein
MSLNKIEMDLLVYFMADDAADRRATNGARRAATGQHCTADRTDAGTDCGVSALR